MSHSRCPIKRMVLLNGLSKLLLICLCCIGAFARVYADEPRPSVLRARDGDLEMLVNLSALGAAATDADQNPSHLNTPTSVRAQMFLHNVGKSPVRVITSSVNGFHRIPGGFLFSHSIRKVEGRLVRSKPSQLEIVELRPGEMVELGPVYFTEEESPLNGKRTVLVYKMPSEVAEVYDVWHGRLEVTVGS